ncbi:MAG: CTP synthase [Treponema sp.]|nr:CTP synthase [Treponema sp.]MCL2250639.1 CTP synthase [Treponema sp.]
MNKFIFVSGGVCSSLGKGVAASSIGALLESRGLNVRMVKCDPYINVDAGTMSPYQHGEVYVTDDGAETDLDLGNYARFTKGRLSLANSITTGQVYESVIRKEREGKYLGKCVQVIPHITDEIKSRILTVANEDTDNDIVIIEIGGTVGDIESIPFLEAARQMIHEQGKKNAISVHLTLIPEVACGELKTKPTQHSVKTMLETGIQPDILICRSPVMLDEPTCRKIAQFTNVDRDAVFTSPDINTTIYQIPMVFFDQKLDEVILRKMGIESRHADMRPWHSVMEKFASRQGKVRIGVIGKYMDINDTYISLYAALFHAGLENGVNVELEKLDSSALEDKDNTDDILGKNGLNLDGILVPGGFGQRGINGMVKAAAWARENKKPYFGICLGMQIMVIEWARNVLKWTDADSTEFSPDSKHPVVSLLVEQVNVKNYGGTMRLGASETVNEEGSHIMAAYGNEKIIERHRHRYEFSNQYRNEMTNSGLKLAAFNSDGSLVECIEWPHEDHPWGCAVQFHPEYKSKPNKPSPLFKDFIAACIKEQKG